MSIDLSIRVRVEEIEDFLYSAGRKQRVYRCCTYIYLDPLDIHIKVHTGLRSSLHELGVTQQKISYVTTYLLGSSSIDHLAALTLRHVYSPFTYGLDIPAAQHQQAVESIQHNLLNQDPTLCRAIKKGLNDHYTY